MTQQGYFRGERQAVAMRPQMTRAQLDKFDRAAQAMLDLTDSMGADDVLNVIAEFLIGRPDILIEHIDAMGSKVVRGKMADRLNPRR